MGSLLTILVGLAVVSVAPLSGVPNRPGQPEHARAAFPPIACSWSGIDRRRYFMERALPARAVVREPHPALWDSLTIQQGLCTLHRLLASGYCLKSTGNDQGCAFQAGALRRRGLLGQQLQPIETSMPKDGMSCHAPPNSPLAG